MSDPKHEQFLSLFLAVQGDLRAFLSAIVRDKPLEDDLFQDIALTLWTSFDKYDPTRSFGAWARGVAANKIKADRRIRARNPQAFPPEVIESVAQGFDADDSNGAWQERESALRDCLDTLPPNASKLITERYGQNKTIDVIASGFCLTPDAVYQALSRVRKQLRDCVQKRLRRFFGGEA
ncbi:MAG: sigma-70 family RNA polymerase sigma factor [Prosthecobacter sp.]|jgi:RNA polymerase sigma-70 factor (ECF subfamily)